MHPQDQHGLLYQLKTIRNHCNTYCRHLERWPSYFDRRYTEFVSYMQLMPSTGYSKVLELGCGIGYQSAMIAQLADKVVATDLPGEDMATHSPGLAQAEKLLGDLNVRNVELVACSAESLPFPDDTFDMVFSSHVLEHVPDRQKANEEIFRVLRPGGFHFCVVPASFEKVYAFFNYHVYLLKRSAFHLFRLIGNPAHKKVHQSQVAPANSNVKKSARQQLAYFPFPPPHGEYPGFLSELFGWTTERWTRSVLESAPYRLESVRTTQFLPFMPMTGQLYPVLGTKLHEITSRFERRLGRWSLFRFFGINRVMVFSKPGSTGDSENHTGGI